jgi:restriction system protein
MYGLMAHHRADAVCIAALGGFTRAAERFASDKPIELIDAPALLALVSSVQQDEGLGSSEPSQPARLHAAPADSAAPVCPHCQATMVLRHNKTSGEAFWGCSAYPVCRGTRAASAPD